MSEEFDFDFRPKNYWGPQSLARIIHRRNDLRLAAVA